MKIKSLFWSATVLLICNFISRLLGFLYRIVLVRLLGPEGIGVTEMAGPIYSLALVIAGLGIPLAMSRLLAQEIGQHRYHNLRRIHRSGTTLLLLLGLAASITCFTAAPCLINRFCSDPRGLYYLRMISPAIFLVTLCSGFRAYFQGTQQIYIIGLAQNIEQLTRVATGALLVTLALPHGLDYAIAAVAAATVLGELTGLLFTIYQYRRQRLTPEIPDTKISYTKIPATKSVPNNPHTRTIPPDIPRRHLIHYFLAFGTPVTLQRLLATAILMLQAVIIPQTLQQCGLSPAEATAAYGNFSGVALTLIHLPGIFTATLVMALLPSIAESCNNTLRLTHRINQSLQITAVISLPFMLFFYHYAEPLCRLLFKAPEAAPSLKILASAAFFIYTQTALDGILQGMGRVRSLLPVLAISGAAYIAALVTLIPRLGVPGAAAAYLVFAATGCLLAFVALRLALPFHLDTINILLKPTTAALLTLAVFHLTHLLPIQSPTFPPEASEFTALSAATITYLLTLAATNGIPPVFLRSIRPFLPHKHR